MKGLWHTRAYRFIKAISRTLTSEISLGARIYLSAFVIVCISCATFVATFYFQQKQAMVSKDILDTRINAMEIALKIKESVVSYDNTIFRYIVTKSQDDLQQKEDLKTTVLSELAHLNTFTTNYVIRSRISALRTRLQRYFEEADKIIELAKSNDLPADSSLFRAASWARNQGLQQQELSALSSAGESRLEQVFALCDEIYTYNRAQVAVARTEIDETLNRSQRIGQTVLLASAGIVFFVAIGLAISLLGPLRALLDGVIQVEKGNLDIEVPVTNSNELGQLTSAFNRMAATIRDQRQKLLQETITDDLTGVYNRRYFSRRLDQEFDRARRAKTALSLMMIDVDHFKNYNDTHGHEIGNVVLKKVCEVIQENLRQIDLLFRYGGDEFAAVLPEATSEEASVIAERLSEAIRQCQFPGDKNVIHKITLSIGGASYPEQAKSAVDLVSRADEALYEAKGAGRNCFRWNRTIQVVS